MQWISILEGLPEDRKSFLVCLKDGTILIGRHIASEWLLLWGEGESDECPERPVTHWMPLPPAADSTNL